MSWGPDLALGQFLAASEGGKCLWWGSESYAQLELVDVITKIKKENLDTGVRGWVGD